jgi:hypothetical protein
MHTAGLVFAYFSPESLLPVTSIIATVIGVVMMLGRGVFRFIVRFGNDTLGRTARVAGTSKPHLNMHDEKQAPSPRL